MPLGILDVPSCAHYGHFLLLITHHQYHELCISYVAIGYTHMDTMEAIIANVYAYIVMGEFKGWLVHTRLY